MLFYLSLHAADTRLMVGTSAKWRVIFYHTDSVKGKIKMLFSDKSCTIDIFLILNFWTDVSCKLISYFFFTVRDRIQKYFIATCHVESRVRFI